MRVLYFIFVIYSVHIAGLVAQNRSFYEISRLPFTSDRYDEFAPAYYDGGLVYTSNQRTGFLITRMTREDENLFNIFYTDQSRLDNWMNPRLFSKSLQSNYHDGPVSFSADGSMVFFTRNLPGRRYEKSTLGIFMADNANGQWVNIRPFPWNNNNYNLTHPSISNDGRTLFFASDMPGGFGGMDIYMSRLEGNRWSVPENLGEIINSPGDEVFPYIHPGGRIYYSSDNNNSRLDLYFSSPGSSGWMKPVRLPKPINSEADEFGFIAEGDLGKGYFSSNREGTDNIYSFISTFPLFTQCSSIQEPELCYEFYEQRGEAVDTTLFYFQWDMGDGTIIRGLEADHCFKDTGTYIIRLNVLDLVTGEMQYNVAEYRFTIERIQQPYIHAPDTVRAGRSFILDASESYIKDFDTEGFYWETGDGAKYEGETITHSYAEPGTYQVRLGMLPLPGTSSGQQRACVYKFIVVTE